MLTLIILILSITLFLSIMAIAVLLPIRPDIVRVTERFVCPAGSKMNVQLTRSDPQKPNQRGLVVTCQGGGKDIYVNSKAFLWLWLIFFIISSPVAIALGIVINGNLPS